MPNEFLVKNLRLIVMGALLLLTAHATGQDTAWPRFVIDDSLRGADGVRLTDANDDGLLDIVTGWEESGQTRAYFHPGAQHAKLPWPKVDVGESPSIEDAVWVDLNGNGQLDILSSCEGQQQAPRSHIADSQRPMLDPKSWSTSVIEPSLGITRWMFATPFPPRQNSSLPSLIVVGSKSPNGMVGLLRFSESDSSWKIENLCDAKWIMSLHLVDLDGDADLDILYSDRKGEFSGVYWLENAVGDLGLEPAQFIPKWPKPHLIGAAGQEVMFIAPITNATTGNNRVSTASEILVAVKPHHIYRFSAGPRRNEWRQTITEVNPSQAVGTAKGIAHGDLDGDGIEELVFTCEGAVDGKSGVIYLKRNDESRWDLHDVSGPEGIKFDLVELVDLDLDGDLDILTCEERHAGRGLGIIWYANPRQ